MNLDSIDKKLINLIQNDSKQTTKQLSLQLNLSITAVYERLKKLEKEQIIKKYVAIINKNKINKSFLVSEKGFPSTEVISSEFKIRDSPSDDLSSPLRSIIFSLELCAFNETTDIIMCIILPAKSLISTFPFSNFSILFILNYFSIC